MPGVPLEIAARSGAGAAFALPSALAALAARKLDAVVIGGAHTDYDPETIAALERPGPRLHAGEPRRGDARRGRRLRRPHA